jgi:Ca-activated chloride channel family protein
MKLNVDDPRLLDYVLGELTTEEAAAVRAALEAPENAEARRYAEEMGVLADQSRAVLSEEATGELGEERREAVAQEAAGNVVRFSKPSIWRRPRVLAVAAMALVVGVAGSIWVSQYRSNNMELAALDQEEQAYHQQMSELKRIANGGGAVDISPEEEQIRWQTEAVQSAPPAPTAPAAPAASPPPADADWDDLSVGSMSGRQAAGNRAPSAPPPTAVAPEAAEELEALGYLGDGISAEPAPPPPAPKPMPEAPVPHEKADKDAYGLEDSPGAGQPLTFGTVRNRPTPPGEAYAPIHENDFEPVRSKPLSTFSVDVDTAAYSNVRRFLENGQLPPPNAVRLEEMVNYFEYDYTPPKEGSPFSVAVDVAGCPWAPDHRLAKIGVKGQVIEASERPATNLVFLIDVSGSMNQPNKLPLVRESMKALVRQLDERDFVGIVTYASGSQVVLPPTNGEQRGKITAAIDSLSAGGSTHGSAGIRDAYRLARKHFIKGGVNRVVLATDGDFNVGVTDRNALVDIIQREAKSNVFLTALGFGMGNIKDATLEQIADKGNGNYAYIDDFAEARRELVDKMTGTLVTIAKDVKIQVEFNPAQVQAYRLLGYENRALAAEDFNDDTKDAGEIGAGHTVTALYEIVPVGARLNPNVDALKYQPVEDAPPVEDRPASDELMTVKLRYKQPEGDRSAKLEFPVTDSGMSFEEANADFKQAAATAAFGMILRNSEHKGTATLDDVLAWANDAEKGKAERREFQNLVVTTKTLMERYRR